MMFGCYTRNKVDNEMPNLTLENIANACEGTYVGDPSKKQKIITGAVTDSRKVEEGFLFIPIKGERVDGHDFIPSVFEKGALAVLSELELENPAGPYILVESSTEAMKKIAAFYREGLDIKVVGITGSVGKTSTKEMIASVLSQKYEVLKTAGNFNNEIGLPLTIFQIKKKHQVAVLEMGISDFGEMHRLAAMAQPDVCVITNIGLCHLENLLTRDGILKAKTESFEHLTPEGTAVLNGDDDKLCEKKMVNGKPVVFYGIGKEAKLAKTEQGEKYLAEKEVYATDVEPVGLDGTKAVIHIGAESFAVTIPIAGEHNVYNALAAVCVAGKLGLSVDEMKRGIESVKTIGGRSNLIHKNGITIIDDCYNANPVSMKASLEVLQDGANRRVAILGDMGELGENEKALHAEVGAFAAGLNIDAIYCAGPLSEAISDESKKTATPKDIRHFATRAELMEALPTLLHDGDTILVKASHFMQFTQIVDELKK